MVKNNLLSKDPDRVFHYSADHVVAKDGASIVVAHRNYPFVYYRFSKGNITEMVKWFKKESNKCPEWLIEIIDRFAPGTFNVIFEVAGRTIRMVPNKESKGPMFVFKEVENA